MTLCIAASCQYKGHPAFVLCSDTRSLSGSREWGLTISSENASKARFLDAFDALVAGNPSEADVLLANCVPAVRKFSKLIAGDDSDLYTRDFQIELREAAQITLKKLQDHYIATHSPFKNGDDFLLRGKASLPDPQYRDLWFEVKGLTLDCEVIIAGFHGDEAIIMKIDGKGKTEWKDEYCVIGSGSADALSFLAQNDYDDTQIELEDCLLRLVEALDFAATSNNTVGHYSRFEIHVHEEPEAFDVTDTYFKFLKSKIRLGKVRPMPKRNDFLHIDGKPATVSPVPETSDKQEPPKESTE